MIHIILFLLPTSSATTTSFNFFNLPANPLSMLFTVAMPSVLILFVLMVIQYIVNILSKIRSAVLK